MSSLPSKGPSVSGHWSCRRRGFERSSVWVVPRHDAGGADPQGGQDEPWLSLSQARRHHLSHAALGTQWELLHQTPTAKHVHSSAQTCSEMLWRGGVGACSRVGLSAGSQVCVPSGGCCALKTLTVLKRWPWSQEHPEQSVQRPELSGFGHLGPKNRKARWQLFHPVFFPV